MLPSEFPRFDERPPVSGEVLAEVMGKLVCQSDRGLLYVDAPPDYKTFLIMTHREDGKPYKMTCGHDVHYGGRYTWWKDEGIVLDLDCSTQVKENAYGQPCFAGIGEFLCWCAVCDEPEEEKETR